MLVVQRRRKNKIQLLAEGKIEPQEELRLEKVFKA